MPMPSLSLPFSVFSSTVVALLDPSLPSFLSLSSHSSLLLLSKAFSPSSAQLTTLFFPVPPSPFTSSPLVLSTFALAAPLNLTPTLQKILPSHQAPPTPPPPILRFSTAMSPNQPTSASTLPALLSTLGLTPPPVSYSALA